MKGDMKLCTHCHMPESDHRLVNASDGIAVGEFFLICPTAVFVPVTPIGLSRKSNKSKRRKK